MNGAQYRKTVEVECLVDGVLRGTDLRDRNIHVALHEPFTVRHLIETLEHQFPKLKGKIKDSNDYLPYLMIVVNGYEILPVSEDNRKLEEGDKISLMYLDVGG